MSWISVIIGLLTGSVVWEAIKLITPEIARKIKNYNAGRKAFYTGLNPILKASDELYGKIYSLSKEDFATFHNPAHSYSEDTDHNKKYTIYLFAQFWAQLEYIRLRSEYTSLTEIKKGRQLINFIETIESRDFRILDRSLQRVIGEILIEGASSNFRTLSLNQFITQYEILGSDVNKWARKIEDKLNNTADKKIRQRILVFGVIVAALIDHLDPHHNIIHPNRIYVNKLSTSSKNIIKGRLLRHYLKFIKRKEKYYKER